MPTRWQTDEMFDVAVWSAAPRASWFLRSASCASACATDDVDTTRLVIKPLRVHHEGVDELSADAIEFAGLSRSWKVDDVRQLP